MADALIKACYFSDFVFYDEYAMFGQHRCIGESTNDNGCVLIRLPESDDLSEIRAYLKTENIYPARMMAIRKSGVF